MPVAKLSVPRVSLHSKVAAGESAVSAACARVFASASTGRVMGASQPSGMWASGVPGVPASGVPGAASGVSELESPQAARARAEVSRTRRTRCFMGARHCNMESTMTPSGIRHL
jgi:hypothetical protein